MPIYENDNDREKEASLIERVEKDLHIRWLKDCRCIQTPTRCSYDFKIYIEGSSFFGVGEIKSRNRSTEFFKKNGWVFSVKQVLDIKEALKKLGQVYFILVLHTSDDDMFFVSNMMLEINKGKLKAAPKGMMKDDHGKKESNRKGFIIPFEVLTKLGEVECQI